MKELFLHLYSANNYEKYINFWEELMAYVPLTQQKRHRKRRLQQFFVAAGTFLPCCYQARIRGNAETDTRPTILLLSVLVAVDIFYRAVA
jgi:hypothetical protein